MSEGYMGGGKSGKFFTLADCTITTESLEYQNRCVLTLPIGVTVGDITLGAFSLHRNGYPGTNYTYLKKKGEADLNQFPSGSSFSTNDANNTIATTWTTSNWYIFNAARFYVD